MLAGVIAVGAISMLPVGVAVAGGFVLSGARRWNAGQSEIAVVFGAAADTAAVTSFSLREIGDGSRLFSAAIKAAFIGGSTALRHEKGSRPEFSLLDRVEGVGSTAAALLNRDKDLYILKSLRTFESLLLDPGADETALRKGWKDCVVQLQYFARHVAIDAAGYPRNGTAADVQAVKEDVGLWFNTTPLMAAYQRRLDTRGVQLTLETTYVSGNDRWAIPSVFLE